MNTKIYPRLHIILARESSEAIVIRRGPSKHTAVIGWDRETDHFSIGQWLNGKIYHHRSDISPDGKHWIYFAFYDRREIRTATVVAKVPYLKAIDFYLKDDAWNGGGIFLKNNTYWLNETQYSSHSLQKKGGNLIVKKGKKIDESVDGEDFGIYSFKLIRDGWKKINTIVIERHHKVYFHKSIGKEMVLCKIFNATIDHPIGKGCYYEQHEIIDIKNERIWKFPDWEWADLDNGRIIWAEYGKIMRGNVDDHGIRDMKELFDTNPLTFERIKAPY